MESIKEKIHNLTLTNGSHIAMTGIVKVEAMSSTQFIARLSTNRISVIGVNIEVVRLNVDSGEAELDGKISTIKYSNPANFTPLFKRIFK